MSLPRELLDELLSRYMDGDLSDDERIRVEQIFDEKLWFFLKVKRCP